MQTNPPCMYGKRPHITKLWPVFARTITDALSNKGPASERVTPSVHVRTLSFPSVPSTMSNKMLNGTKIATAIHNATEDSMQPVPGYVFQEIVNTTHANPGTSDAFEKAIFDRLKKNKPNIKWKCLMMIKHVTPKANQSFRRAMQDHVAEIKECLQFRGQPHPTYGDSLFKRVRDEAAAALESIFQDAPRNNPQANLQSRIQGISAAGISSGVSVQPRFGAEISGKAQAAMQAMEGSKYSTGGGGKGTSSMGGVGSADASVAYGGINGRKMQGFGNPNFDNAPKKSSVFDKLKETALNKAKELATGQKVNSHPRFGASDGNPSWMNNATGASTYNYANNRGAGAGAVSTQGGGYSGPGAERPVVVIGRGTAGTSAPAMGAGEKVRPRGQVGGVWGGPPSTSVGVGKFGGSSMTSFDRRDSDAATTTGGGKAGKASKDGVYEATLVDSICSGGGLRPVPSTTEVNAFLERVKSLDPSVIAPLLVAKVDSEDWKVNLKALVVMEAMTKDPAFASCADYFYEEKEAIEDLIEDSSQSQVKSRCRRVLKGLGVEGYDEIPEEAATTRRVAKMPVAAKPKPTTSLLDVSASDPAPVDMMAGLTVSSSKPAAANATTEPDNGFDFLGEPATTSAAPAAPSADAPASGFGFLGQSTAPPASTSADDSAFHFLGDTPAAPAAPPASGMDDLLLSMIDAPAKPAPAKPADPFADLLGGNDANKSGNNAAAPSSVSSFNFLSSPQPTTATGSATTPTNAMAQIQQAQQIYQMQQMQRQQMMQQQQVLQMQRQMQGAGAPNNSMMTGVRAAGTVKHMDASMFAAQAGADKKKAESTAFSFVGELL